MRLQWDAPSHCGAARHSGKHLSAMEGSGDTNNVGTREDTGRAQRHTGRGQCKIAGISTGYTRRPSGPPESSGTCWEAPRPPPPEKAPETSGKQRTASPALPLQPRRWDPALTCCTCWARATRSPGSPARPARPALPSTRASPGPGPGPSSPGSDPPSAMDNHDPPLPPDGEASAEASARAVRGATMAGLCCR